MMRKFVGCLILLLVVGLLAASAFAAELRATGFIDNTFPRWDSNNSNADLDATRNGDQVFFGRSRLRTFFNFIASDDLRGVFAIEIDQTTIGWGRAVSRGAVPSHSSSAVSVMVLTPTQ